MRRDRLGTLMRAARLGDVVHLHFPNLETVLLNHPELARRVLVDDHRSFSKQTRGYDTLRIGLGNGLVTSEGSFWRRQRRIMQPGFHRRKVAGFAETMTQAALDMVESWGRAARMGQPIDVDAEMMSLTFRIVGECLFGTDIRGEAGRVGAAVTTLLEGVVDRVTRPVLLPLSFPTPANRRLRDALRVFDDLVLGIIAERRRSGVEHDDLLDMLIRARDEETGESMTDAQLRDEVITLVLAGHETTATALSWTFYLLSKAPAVNEKLREELERVLPGGRRPTVEDLRELTYTEAVFKESMRLFPPVWLVARRVTETLELGGYTVPAGYVAFVSPYVMHHDSRSFANPEGFVPERFLGDRERAIPKMAYVPFIAGPRQCIGNIFAMMEAQLILAVVLSRYDLYLVAGQSIEPLPSVTLRPKHGLRMTLAPAASAPVVTATTPADVPRA